MPYNFRLITIRPIKLTLVSSAPRGEAEIEALAPSDVQAAVILTVCSDLHSCSLVILRIYEEAVPSSRSFKCRHPSLQTRHPPSCLPFTYPGIIRYILSRYKRTVCAPPSAASFFFPSSTDVSIILHLRYSSTTHRHLHDLFDKACLAADFPRVYLSNPVSHIPRP